MKALVDIRYQPNQAHWDDQKKRTSEYIDHCLRRMPDYPDFEGDQCLSTRISTLWRLGRRRDVEALYKDALGGRRAVGPRSQAAFIQWLLDKNRIEAALDVLKQHNRSCTFSAPNNVTFQAFVFGIANPRSVTLLSRRYSAFIQAIKLLPSDVRLNVRTLGTIIPFMLEVGTDTEGIIDRVFKQIRDEGNFMGWSAVIEGVLRRGSRVYEANLGEVLTALVMLEELGGRSQGLTAVRATRLWEMVFRLIATSQKLTPAERRKCIDRAIQIFPKDLGSLDDEVYFSIIKHSLARRLLTGAAEENATSEAMYRFDEMKRIFSPLRHWFWLEMLQALGRSRRLDRALNLVTEAWTQDVQLEPQFWETAEALGLTAGIDSDALSAKKKRSGEIVFPHRQGWKRFSNNVYDSDREMDSGVDGDDEGPESAQDEMIEDDKMISS